MRRRNPIVLVLFAVLLSSLPGRAYSLLTHEQLIDLAWQDSIVPLLLSRYPNLTPTELERARAYAYGGCVVQDIGYYPFGDASFSNLTHYVRTGDFVVALFRNAQNANELAFAVGALSHYIGDTVGHPGATNIAVPVEFPALGAKYGPVVNYAEGRRQHVQTEFAFDIDEIAHHHLAPLGYLRHIGLRVPVRQVALAYYQTYGISGDFSRRKRIINVRTYRFAVHAFIPRIAYALTILHRRREPPEPDTAEVAALNQKIAAMAAVNDWNHYRRRPGVGTYMLAGLIFIVPKIGFLRLVDIKGPTPATEEEYMHSVVESLAALRMRLERFTPPTPAAQTAGAEPQATVALAALTTSTPMLASEPRHPLPNRDLDTGHMVDPGGYPLTDATYARLLHRLTRTPAQPIPPGIQKDILAYYAKPEAPIATRKNAARWATVQADLAVLAQMQTSDEPAPYPTYGVDAGEDE